MSLLLADSVEEVRELIGLNAAVTVTMRQIASLILCQAGFKFGIGINLASLRRFWAVAARRNSSRAPFGPRSRSRSSLRMRLRWANNISTFLRSRREVRPSQDLAICRAISRAPSWMEHGTLRAGAFGQHLSLRAHAAQSCLLAR